MVLMVRSFPHPLTCFIFIAAALLFYARLPMTLADTDALWHLATGETISARNFEIPRVDPWTFSAGTMPWLNLSWSFDVGFYLLGDRVGLGASLTIMALLMALVVAIVAQQVISHTHSPVVTLAIAWIAALLLVLGLAPRPQIFTYLGVAVLLMLLETAPRWYKPLLCALLMLAWVNLHGGFVLGLGLIALYAAVAVIQRDWRASERLLLMLIASVLVLPINPYGMGVFEGVWRTLGGALSTDIQEWQPLNPMQSPFSAFILFVVSALALWKWRSLSLREGLLLLLALGMGASAVRHLPLLAILASIPIATLLQAVMQTLPRLKERDEEYARDMQQKHAALKGVVFALVFIAASFTPFAQKQIFASPPAFAGAAMPYDAIGFLRQQLHDARVLNHYDFGGALASFGRGRVRYFIDGRAETAFPDDVTHAAQAFERQSEGWERLLINYQIDAVLVPVDHPSVAWFHAQADYWQGYYRDDQAVIFKRHDYQPGPKP